MTQRALPQIRVLTRNISTSTPNKEVFKAPAAKTAPSKKRKLEDPDQPSSTTSASRSKVTKVDSSSDSTSNSVLKYFNLNYERSSSNVVQMSGFRTNSIVNEDIGADSDCQSIVGCASTMYAFELNTTSITKNPQIKKFSL
ncbi:unnamed protein product [Trichogramma brassicae]|uniref:Uncharacterized protein n=1 Tax=Trichogramma brassicae TaxID=86971 RepID=A0A6H5J2F1_9HYME|nr:unnamed protein product [Trichogramma brassicae]